MNLDAVVPRTIQLKPFVFYDMTRLSAHAIERVSDDGSYLRRMFDADAVEVRFRLKITASLPVVVERYWPASWWDAVKLRFFPRWALRRWPATMDGVYIQKAGLYPEIPWQGGKLMAIPYFESSDLRRLDHGGDDE